LTIGRSFITQRKEVMAGNHSVFDVTKPEINYKRDIGRGYLGVRDLHDG